MVSINRRPKLPTKVLCTLRARWAAAAALRVKGRRARKHMELLSTRWLICICAAECSYRPVRRPDRGAAKVLPGERGAG